MSNKRDVIFLDHLHRLVIANDGNDTQTMMMRWKKKLKEEERNNRENDNNNKMKQKAEDEENEVPRQTGPVWLLRVCSTAVF